MTWRIASDPALCIGCLACVVACMQQKSLPAGCSLIEVKVEETTSPPYDLRCQINYCRHCADAPCQPVCPASAIERAPGGQIRFTQEPCTGCLLCVQACPYDAIRVNPANGTALSCDVCMTAGGEPRPACVRHCPSGALTLVDS